MKKAKTTELFDDIPFGTKISEKKEPTKEGVIAKKFIEEYFVPRYEEFFGIPPVINWGKDLRLVIKIIKTYKDISIFGIETHYDFLVKVCEKYFVSKDNLALKSTWGLNIFYTNFQKLAFLLKHAEETGVQEMIEGYKLAYFNYTGNKCEDSFINQGETFAQVYIFIKPLWGIYGREFILERFSEIYFLILFEHMSSAELNLDFFYSKYAKGFFGNWLETDGKEILMFFPKEVGFLSQEKLEMEEAKMMAEERALINK